MSSEIEVVGGPPPSTAVVPTTGEIIDLNDPVAVTTALRGIREMEQKARAVKPVLVEALVRERERQGTGTLHLEGVGTVKVTEDTEWVYTDPREMALELIQAGLPEDRAELLVKPITEWKVDGNVARQLHGASPAYREIIDRHRRKVSKGWRAS